MKRNVFALFGAVAVLGGMWCVLSSPELEVPNVSRTSRDSIGSIEPRGLDRAPNLSSVTTDRLWRTSLPSASLGRSRSGGQF